MEKKKSMTPDEQLEMWVAGKSVHNPDRYECCPDFSCCNPELLADVETRRAFMAANEEERGKMLYDFWGKLKRQVIAVRTRQSIFDKPEPWRAPTDEERRTFGGLIGMMKK